MKHTLCLVFSFVLSLLLFACGGGGGGGEGSTTASSPKAITAFSLAGYAGTINETNKTIAVSMPFGTNIMALVATFTTNGTRVSIGATNQTSGNNTNDFTNPVIYTVMAADNTTVNYTVTTTLALNSAKTITTFSLTGVAGTINDMNKTIAVTMPYGTNVTALAATYTTYGIGVSVGATSQISGTTTNNFTNPVIYTVTAADTTVVNYTVTVTVSLLPAGFVSQGGLTWMPTSITDSWVNANAYCANTVINGQLGWRLPTLTELSSLYVSGAMLGHGWIISGTWSSTPAPYASYWLFNLIDSTTAYGNGYSMYVTCVK